MTKFEELYVKVVEIIEWAENNKFISEDAATTLIRNIGEEKDRIESNI